jgi:hypothetical protein
MVDRQRVEGARTAMSGGERKHPIRRPRAYLDLPAGSEERQDAFDAHLEAIRDDAARAEVEGATEDPYAGSGEPHESAAWRGGIAESRLFAGPK